MVDEAHRGLDAGSRRAYLRNKDPVLPMKPIRLSKCWSRDRRQVRFDCARQRIHATRHSALQISVIPTEDPAHFEGNALPCTNVPDLDSLRVARSRPTPHSSHYRNRSELRRPDPSS